MENLTWNSWKWKQLTPHEPVNRHGHTYSQAQWHSFAPTSWCCEYQKTVSSDICFTKWWHSKKNNTTSNSHYMRENSPCILFLYYTISGYSWNQNINANASPTRDTALGHSLTKGGLICKMNKIVIWPHRNCDVTGKTPCLLHVLRLKLCTYTPLYK